MLPLKRTLGDIRSDIQIRLGFGMAGQAGIVNSALIDSMIRSAQNQLYEQYDWLELKGVEERATGSNQALYDYPADCNVERPVTFSILWGGRYIPLKEGISVYDRGTNAGSIPMKYERREQYELWPVPQSNDLTIRIEYIKTLSPLVVDTDRVSLNSEAVFLHALANAKAHYRQPDSQTYASQLDSLLSRIKARHRGQSVWDKTTPIDPYSIPPTDDQVV